MPIVNNRIDDMRQFGPSEDWWEDCVARARRDRRQVLREDLAKRRLLEIGIAVPNGRVVSDKVGVAQVLSQLHAPYVVKLVSPDVNHKSDVEGVQLSLADQKAVEAAIDRIISSCDSRSVSIEGFLIEEMVPSGHELAIGGLIDPGFGPVVMVGLGGIFVEVFEDVAFGLCPLTLSDAGEMLDQLRASPILSGFRSGRAANRATIIDVLMRLGSDGGLIETLAPEVREIDINPLIVTSTAAVAADARFVLRQT
jgi:acetate---CoA ligase (ADP-forming) subunit beta